MQSNVDTLTNKRDEFMLNIRILKPDIICLQEVLPKNSHTGPIDCDIELKLDGYEMYCADAMQRGTVTYVSKNYPSLQMPTVEVKDTVTCKILNEHSGPMIICNIYRSPNSDRANDSAIHRYISDLTSETADSILICGDFNHPQILWDTETGLSNGAKSFLECIQENFLTQHVTETTRHREGQQDSLLDLILTDRMDLISDLQYLAPVGKSDHATLLYKLKSNTRSNDPKVSNFNYYKGNYTAMKEEIASIDWEDILSSWDIDDCWEVFEKTIISSIEKNIPSSSSRPKRKRWLNKDAEQTVRNKKRCYNRYSKKKSQQALEEYKQARNRATQLTREARKAHESGIANNIADNPKEFWAYVKSQTGTGAGIAPITTPDGALASNPTDKAQTLNDFFASVFTREDLASIPEALATNTGAILDQVNFSPEIIQREIKAMKNGKSAGPDGIHPKVIKETSQEISVALSVIFTRSMEAGHLPTAWKRATVVPIYKKKGSKNSASNYRPVSLTSVCGKLMERVVRRQLYDAPMHLYE